MVLWVHFPAAAHTRRVLVGFFAWHRAPGASPKAAHGCERLLRWPWGHLFFKLGMVMGVIFSPDTCLSPEMPSSRGNLLKIGLPSTFGHLSFFCLILCPQLSLPPHLLGFPLLGALCWCLHNLFSLLNGFWRLIYITQHSRKWSRVGELLKLITARRTSRVTSGLISFLPQHRKARDHF